MFGVNDGTLKRHSWFGCPSNLDESLNPGRAGHPHSGLPLQNSLDDNMLLSDSQIPSSDPNTMYAQSYARYC